MMHFVDVAFFWLAAIGQSVAKVELRKGVNQTVTFEGEEVEIHVNKEIDRAGFLIICFGSAPDTSFDFCPKGYATFSTTSEATTRHHILKVNRQGRLTQDSSDRGVAGTIEFNEDGALNILVKKLPDDGTTVILPNAEKWVPKPTVKVDETKKKPKSNVTVYVVIACCFLLLLIITGIMIYFYINRRKKDPMPLGSPQEERPINKTRQAKVTMAPVTQHVTTQSTGSQTNSITHSQKMQVFRSAKPLVQLTTATGQVGDSTPPNQRMPSNKVFILDSNKQSDYSMKHPSDPR